MVIKKRALSLVLLGGSSFIPDIREFGAIS